MRIVSANVNGIRAAARRGGLAELAGLSPDVLCLQEVRADVATTGALLARSGLGDFEVHCDPGERAGHAGVAILVRPGLTLDLAATDSRLGQGRWLAGSTWGTGNDDPASPRDVGAAAGRGTGRAPGGTGPDGVLARPVGAVAVATTYVPTGAGGDAAAEAKQEFLAAVGDWLAAHRGLPAILTGDLNVARTNDDIRNWRGNLGKPGFLPEERAHLDRWVSPTGMGWVDVGRAVAGEVAGPYTWWSWRGRAFDNDSGWRIDYILISPVLAQQVRDFRVLRAASYDQRWSDHAAVLLDVEI